MTKLPQSVLELPLAERGLLALKAAVEKVIEEHARAPDFSFASDQSR